MENKSVLRSRLYAFIREQQQILRNSTIACEIHEALKKMQMLTLQPPECYALQQYFSNFDVCAVCEEFKKSYLNAFLDEILNILTVEWAAKGLVGKNNQVFEDLFLNDVTASSSFLALCRCIAEKGPGFGLNKSVTLLQKFLERKLLDTLLLQQCSRGVSKEEMGLHLEHWNQLVQHIATVPERITNKLHRETDPIFFPDQYCGLICDAMFVVMATIHANLVAEKESSVQFLSLLLGKLCLCGQAAQRSSPQRFLYGAPRRAAAADSVINMLVLLSHCVHSALIPERVWSRLLPRVLARTRSDFIWCRVCERLILGVSDRAMESVVSPLLHKLPWYGYMSKLFGHSVVNNRKLEFLLTNKLIFFRFFQNELILQNIIGYLATSPSLQELHTQLLLRLLEAWSSGSALRHTAYEQHVYITKAILISVAFLTAARAQPIQAEMMRRLMAGVQVHLDSSSHPVRRLGMITAEALTDLLNIQQHKLTFEYEEDEETEHLKRLLTVPGDPGLDDVTTHMQQLEVKSAESTHVQHTTTTVHAGQGEDTRDDSDLDSDDDLEPYDLGNDVKATKEKTPVYLRDCMDGLLDAEKPERVEQCLQAAEPLIRRHARSAAEVAVEMSKVLLHLQDSFSLPLFAFWRHRALVSLLVVAPTQVAEYVTGQVYERNYSIMQRLDILQALADAARELSSPVTEEEGAKAKRSLIEPVGEPDSEEHAPEHWRHVVQRRIDSKTRRFGRGRREPESAAVANRFAPVAGCFFFPLLTHADRVQGHLDLLGEDHLVLSRLIHTLGVVMYAALHAPICTKMGLSMMEFIWVVRYHPQPFTRQAVLFAVSMLILAVPPFSLITDLHAHMCELRLWLEDVMEKDSNSECKKMAVQALVLLENSLKQQFGDPAKT